LDRETKRTVGSNSVRDLNVWSSSCGHNNGTTSPLLTSPVSEV